MSRSPREIIVVRALTDSDLGLFAAHRSSASSKQRAININARVAARMLSQELYEKGEAVLDCICVYKDYKLRSPRHFGKIHKNWRLGGKKIEGEIFGDIDSRDFVLIRSREGNDGTDPIFLTFVARAIDPALHEKLVRLVADRLDKSMTIIEQGDPEFVEVAPMCPALPYNLEPDSVPIKKQATRLKRPIAPMPADQPLRPSRSRTIREKLRSPHILEQMLRVSSDLSAPAQVRFMDTVEQLASQLREVLIASGRVVKIQKNHAGLWSQVSGRTIGFVDGGMANLSMLGSAPVAVRVGGYVVTPGNRTSDRERFIVLKKLIDELYADEGGGVYTGSYPDVGALRDAARISLEAAGAVKVLEQCAHAAWVFLHGALVNPVSRYTDVMKDGRPVHRFPDFSRSALAELLPAKEQGRTGRETNFISVYLRQLELLASSSAIVCGVVERESHTTSVIRAVLDELEDHVIRSLLPLPPNEWKKWFRSAVDPLEEEDGEGQRVTDPLLFRCVLEPGEALVPVVIERNDMRRAPEAWKDKIRKFPKPIVSYIQPTEWNTPIRIEMFEKDRASFEETATLVMHCALLLPRYAFPAGLDVVDKFARIPNWMSRPINTNTAVQALKRALDRGDTRLFDALRRMLCGSQREWLLRPGINR